MKERVTCQYDLQQRLAGHVVSDPPAHWTKGSLSHAHWWDRLATKLCSQFL